MTQVANYFSDLRYGVRSLRRSPGFTAAATAILALGMGAATALFSIYDAILLRPLPYEDPASLVVISSTRPGRTVGTASWLEFQELQRDNETFAAIAGFSQADMNLLRSGHAERVPVTAVTPNMFRLLNVQPVRGRSFVESSGNSSSEPGAVISNALWTRDFAGSPDVLGQSITLNKQTFTIIGVAPADFALPYRTPSAIWVNYDTSDEMFRTRGMHFINVLGRLRPGVSLQKAQQDTRRIAAQLHQQFPDEDKDRGFGVAQLSDAWLGTYRTQLNILLGAVILLLTIACANVANLLLARSSVRAAETAIRLAIGADQRSLILLFLLESLLIGTAGGLLGIGLAWSLLRVLRSTLSNYIPLDQVRFLSWHMLGWFLLSVIVSACLVGLLPAWDSLRSGCVILREAGVSKVRPQQRLFRSALMISEVAVSVMLLAGAGLVVKTMWNLLHVPLGLDAERVLSAKVAPAADGKTNSSRTLALYASMLQNLRERHGVEAVGIINNLPLTGPGMTSNFLIPGHLGDEGPEAELRIVSPGYHPAMGIPILRGRDFDDSDTPSSQPVALVNAEASRAFFGNEDPIGREIQLDENSPKRVVIGLTGSTRQREVVDETHPEVDLPYSQLSPDSVIYSLSLQQGMSVVIRSKNPVSELVSDVRNVVSSIDPTTAVFDFESMEEVVQQSVSGERFIMTVLVFFGLTALLLTAAGVYSVTAYLVARRTQEIGIRMALGATRGNILGMVLRHSMVLTASGVILGSVGFVLLGKVLGSFLYHLSYLDISTITAAAFSLALVGLLASCVPAYRAMATNPTSALRQL